MLLNAKNHISTFVTFQLNIALHISLSVLMTELVNRQCSNTLLGGLGGVGSWFSACEEQFCVFWN